VQPAPTTHRGLRTKDFLARGGLWGFALKLASVALVLCGEAMITNHLGLESYDLWATAVSWLSIAAVFSVLGMNMLVVQRLPAARVASEFSLMRGLISWTGARMLAAGLACGLVLFVSRDLLSMSRPALAPILLVVALMVPVRASALHLQAVLRGLKHPLVSQVPLMLVRPFALLLALVALSAAGMTWSPQRLALVWLATLVLAWVVGRLWLMRLTEPQLRDAPSSVVEPKWSGLVVQFFALQLAGMVLTQADPAMLAAFSTPGEAGLYAIADRLSILLLFAQIAVNVVIAPLISQLHASGDNNELQGALIVAARGIAAFTLPAAIFMLLFGPWLLALFGDDFVQAHSALNWLVLGRTWAALSGAVVLLLVMSGHQKIALKILLGSALGKLSLNVVLIPSLGAEGAAISTALMLAICNSWALFEVHRRLGLSSSVFIIFARNESQGAS
jgi:O-antigen/teichoic acid export membrane protein